MVWDKAGLSMELVHFTDVFFSANDSDRFVVPYEYTGQLIGMWKNGIF